MKLPEFNALCDREWSKPKRGDVVQLVLAEASHEELSIDLLQHSGHFGHILPFDEDDLDLMRAGEPLAKAVSPVTRTVVSLRSRPDVKRESARVRVMGGTFRRVGLPAST